jgi:acetyl-CoA synthetase (ADP-forming)
MDLIQKALAEGRTMLSEFEAKQVLAAYGLPVTREYLVSTRDEARDAARKIGGPVVLKGSDALVAHKTEKGWIVADVRNEEEAVQAFDRLTGLPDGPRQVLVQEMIRGKRELVVGLTRDPQFGPSVMFGLGGIFTEILRDVAFRVAPLTKADALDMMAEIRGHKILDAVRGMPPADKDLLADALVGVGRIGLEHPEVQEIDVNPLILDGSRPVAVDALIVLKKD